MKTKLFILVFLTFTMLLFSQSKNQIILIRKKVEAINLEKNYTSKKLDNNYFKEVKNEPSDGGQELTGYYKNGKIKKITYSVGLSYGMKTYEYFFYADSLIFVFEKQNKFAENENGLDPSKLKTIFEGRYYFGNSKLVLTKEIGKEIFVKDDKQSKEKEFLTDSKLFIAELKSVKK